MLSLPPSIRILLAREPADMRKGFDGLAHLDESVLQEDPLSGHLFVFSESPRRYPRILITAAFAHGKAAFLFNPCMLRW
jgi:transposase